jgi:hypothetical protein
VYLAIRGPSAPGERMQNMDREHSGAARLRRIGRLGAAFVALALLVSASAAAAALETGAPFPASDRSAVVDTCGASFGTGFATTIERPEENRIELAQQRRDGNHQKPPERGSSAQLEGGSSADRYGGSSADRRGVAGRYDPRNRGVRQYSASNRKRDRERPKESDELQDQDDDPPRDRFSFTQADPSEILGRRDRD